MDMSNFLRLGEERCMMQSPNKAGMLIKGSSNIDAKLAQGWTIVENDFRNHLLPSRTLAPKPSDQPPEQQCAEPLPCNDSGGEVAGLSATTTKPKRPRIQSRRK